MKLKNLLKSSIILILLSVNIFVFKQLKSKQYIVNNINISEEQKQAEEEKKKAEDNIDKKNEDKVETIKKYIENKNISTVSLSAFNPNLKKFVVQYMRRKYNYNSLTDDRKLEDFYTEELKNKYLESNKGKEPHPKYDEKSRLREDIMVNINTLDEKTFLVTTLHKKDVYFINKSSKQETLEHKNDAYTDTYIIIIEDNKYKILKEEEKRITNINIGG